MRLIIEYFSSMQNIWQKSDKESRGEAVYSRFSTQLSVLVPRLFFHSACSLGMRLGTCKHMIKRQQTFYPAFWHLLMIRTWCNQTHTPTLALWKRRHTPWKPAIQYMVSCPDHTHSQGKWLGLALDIPIYSSSENFNLRLQRFHKFLVSPVPFLCGSVWRQDFLYSYQFKYLAVYLYTLRATGPWNLWRNSALITW